MRVPAPWFRDPVEVATLTGTGARGDVFADPVTVRGSVDATRKVVAGAGGEDVVSEVTVLLQPRVRTEGEDPVWLDALALLRAESKVTAGGTSGRVVAVKAHRALGRTVYVEANLA